MSTPPPSPAVPRRKSRVVPILVTIGGGALLAGGSCAGFQSAFNSSNALNAVFAVGFFAGVLAVIVGGLWALVRAALFFFGSDKNPL